VGQIIRQAIEERISGKCLETRNQNLQKQSHQRITKPSAFIDLHTAYHRHLAYGLKNEIIIIYNV
jgi:hypothetical protein